MGGHDHVSYNDPSPPPSDELNSSGETQTTTVSGLMFIKRGGWVFVSGNSSDSQQTVSSAFCPPSIVNIPYVSPEGTSIGFYGQGISINSSGSIVPLYERGIQPTAYPAREA